MPPPDLTSNAPKQYQVPSAPAIPPQNNASPHFLNPNSSGQSTENFSPLTQHIGSGPSSGQGSSIQSHFSNSPVIVTPHSSSANIQSLSQSQSVYSSNAPPKLGSFSSQPEVIPGRIPEPLVPQNTPAGTNFSGFVAYEKQSPFEISASNANYPGSVFGSINVESKEDIKEEKTFSPISAEKVTEKLEHLIADQKEELKTRKSVDFSSEVSEITSRILLEGKKSPEQQRDFKKSISNFNPNQRENSAETLTEIDLNALASEVPLSSVDGKDPNVNPASILSAANFFTQGSANEKSNLNQLPPVESSEFPTFYNPLDYQNQNTLNPIASSQAQQQRLEPDGSNLSSTANDSTRTVPYPSWNIDKTSHSTVLNPVYSEDTQPIPTFYNPNQFANQFNKPLNDSFTTSTFPKTEAGNFSDIFPTVDVTSGYYSPPTINTLPEPTGTATLSPVQISVNPMSRVIQGTVPPSLENLVSYRKYFDKVE